MNRAIRNRLEQPVDARVVGVHLAIGERAEPGCLTLQLHVRREDGGAQRDHHPAERALAGHLYFLLAPGDEMVPLNVRAIWIPSDVTPTKSATPDAFLNRPV